MSQPPNRKKPEPEPAQRGDRHLPNLILNNPLRRLTQNPGRYARYVRPGQTAADLGSGPGWYTLAIAERVGAQGRVYAVDSNEKAIRALEERAREKGLANIIARTASAAELAFIPDHTVDFIVSDGMLCCIAPHALDGAVREIKRILKPEGKAYLSVASVLTAALTNAQWEAILAGFVVERRNSPKVLGDRWALVSLRPL